ncbi:VENN motif pre-toxin domain-containing protein, partial [Stenotrophomonas sepilia]
SEAMQMLSHALLGALLAEANGGKAGSGALAAGGGELAAKFLTDKLFGGDPSNLSPQERETVLALSQAVGALAGGLSGQDLAGIALNAGIAKNSVENNWLSKQEIALMESERAACGGKGGDVQACKDSVTRAYDELNAERDRELLAYGAAVELSMRSYPATSEDDWKHEWATRVDRYWEQYGVAVEDRVAGPTPGADAAFAYRQLKNDALASAMTAVGEIMDKGLDRWFMDKSRRNLEATLEGLSSTLSLMRGYVSSLHPDIYMQGAIDQSSVMTKTEEMAAYLAILSRGADRGLGALRGSWGIKSPGMGSAVSGTKGVIKASETIGQPVEAVIGGRKRLLRVDIEPNGKLQIQSGGGKDSIVDFRPDLSLPLAPQIDKAFKRLPQSARDQLVKNAEKGLRRLQETGNM